MPIFIFVQPPFVPAAVPGSNPIATFSKDPSAILDFAIDWSQWLGDDSIILSSWSIPNGIGQSTSLFSKTLAIIWLVGGSAGQSYGIVNHIASLGGREEDRTIKINVVER